jgi:hypothetical protein
MIKPLHTYRDTSNKITSEAYLDSSPNISLKNKFCQSLKKPLITAVQKHFCRQNQATYKMKILVSYIYVISQRYIPPLGI